MFKIYEGVNQIFCNPVSRISMTSFMINFVLLTGTLQGTNVDFGHTTISNLKGSDERLWVHVVLVILFLPLGIAIMRHFSVNLGIRDDNKDVDVSSRTLMIAGIPDTYWYVFSRIFLCYVRIHIPIPILVPKNSFIVTSVKPIKTRPS